MLNRSSFCIAVAALLLGALPVKTVLAAPASPIQATYGPWYYGKIGGGGFLQNVVLCPSDPKRVYAYADVTGPFRSDDGGKTWRALMAGLPTEAVKGVRSLVVDPRNANHIVIAAGSQWDPQAGVFVSRDGGATWKKTLAATFASDNFRSMGFVLARQPGKPDVLAVGSIGTGVFRSNDNGGMWTKLGLDGVNVHDLRFDRANPQRLWVCASPRKDWLHGSITETFGGFYRSDDGGKTFAKLADTAPTEIVQDNRDAGVLYGIFKKERVDVSRDGGKTWQPFSEGLPTGGSGFDHRFSALAAGPDFVVTATERGQFFRRGPKDAAWQPVVRQGVVETYAGRDWYGALKNSGPNDWKHFGAALGSITVDPRNPNRWFFTDWYSIYQSRDAGAHWNLSMDGIEVTVLHTLRQDPSDPGVVHLGMADNGYFLSTNGGDSYEHHSPTANMKCLDLSPKLPSRIYGVGDGIGGKWESNTVFRSDDRGRTWARTAMKGLPDLTKTHSNSICVHPGEPNTVYVTVSGPVGAGAGGVYVSRDGGDTWAWMGQGLPAGEPFFRQDIWVTGPEIACDTEGTIIALSRDRKLVYRFDAAAKTWTPTKAGAALAGGSPFSVVTDGRTPGRFLMGGDRVLQSRDGGRTWAVSLSEQANFVALDAANPKRVLAGAQDAVMLSTDGGATWKALDKRLPYRAGNLVAFAGDRVIVGTLANGAYWMPLTPAAARPVSARPLKPAPVSARR